MNKIKKFFAYLSFSFVFFAATMTFGAEYVENFDDGTLDAPWGAGGDYEIINNTLHMYPGSVQPDNSVNSWVDLRLTDEYIYHFESDIQVVSGPEQIVGLVIWSFDQNNTLIYRTDLEADRGSFYVALSNASGIIGSRVYLGPVTFNQWYHLSITYHDDYITVGINGNATDLFQGLYQKPSTFLRNECYIHGWTYILPNPVVDYYVDNLKANATPPEEEEDVIVLDVPVLLQEDYSFSSAFPETRDSLLETEGLILALEDSVFKKKKHKDKLTNFIQEAIISYDEGTPKSIEETKKLIEKIETKVNGCYLTGAPDEDDWIIDCDAQIPIDAQVSKTLLAINNVISGLGAGGCVPTSFSMIFIYYFNQHNIYDLSIDTSPSSSNTESLVNDIGHYLSALVKDGNTWVQDKEITSKMLEYGYSFQPDTYPSPEFSYVYYEWDIEIFNGYEIGSDELMENFKLKLSQQWPVYFSGIHIDPSGSGGHASVIRGYKEKNGKEYLYVNDTERTNPKWWLVEKNQTYVHNGTTYSNIIKLTHENERFFIIGLIANPFYLTITLLEY